MASPDYGFTDIKTDAGVKFNHEVAALMAQQVANMLTVINEVGKVILPAEKVPDVGKLDSAHKLAEMFNGAARNLVDNVIKSHQDILNDMGQAFVAAGKLYVAGDEAARDAFKGTFTDQQLSDTFGSYAPKDGGKSLSALSSKVDSVDVPGWQQSRHREQYQFSGTSKSDYGDKLDGTKDMAHLKDIAGKVARETPQFKGEDGTTLSWDQFHDHWAYIKDNKIEDKLQDIAKDWMTAKKYLEKEADDFNAATQKYLHPYQDQVADAEKVWASPAAQKAKTSVLNYLTNLASLTKSMEVIGTNLADTEGWIHRLQNFLPYSKLTNKGNYWTYLDGHGNTQYLYPTEYNKAMQDLQQAWNNWYVEGIKESSESIPIMPDPKSAMVIKPVEPPKVTDQPDPNTKQPGYTPTTQTPTTQTPNLENLKPTDTDPKNTDPKNTDPKTTTPTTTTDTTLQTLITQASTVIQAGITAAEQGAEKIASAVQTALTQTQTTDKTTQPTDQLTQQLQNLGLIPKTDSPGGSPTGGSPTGGAPTGSPQTPKTQPAPKPATPASTTETETETVTASRAGLASTTSTASSGTSSGMGGSPMGAAGSQGGQGKEHKRPQFLTNLENFDQVVGEAPEAVTPVAEK